MAEKDGGPAFPTIQIYEDNEGGRMPFQHGGMPLRDWFAGMALQGFCVSCVVQNKHWFDGGATINLNSKKIAKVVYQVADDMLAEREKPQEVR